VEVLHLILELLVRHELFHLLIFLGLVVIVIGLIIVGYKLRRVHDAYFVKSEFTMLMIIAIIILPFYFTSTMSSNDTAVMVCWWVIIIICNALAFVRYVNKSYLLKLKFWNSFIFSFQNNQRSRQRIDFNGQFNHKYDVDSSFK
jgi:amino acid transporter